MFIFKPQVKFPILVYTKYPWIVDTPLVHNMNKAEFPYTYKSKAVADSPVGQVLAGPLFIKVKTKFHFKESK